MSEFIDRKKVASFMAELRDVGFEANYLIRRAIDEETERKKQFIIAMLASKEEILHNDFSAIVEYGQYLLGCNDNASLQASRRYLHNKRIITLLNAPWHQKHGEARLLDPDDTILSEVLQRPLNRKEDNYLAKMRDSFNLQFGHEEKPVLLMFSYFIPCTLEQHHCARLINEYAKRNDETIIVGYQTVFRETNRVTAFEQIDNNVTVVPKKYISAYVNTEIHRLFATSQQNHSNAVTSCLPTGWVPNGFKFEDFVYKEPTRKTHTKDKHDRRQFEQSMPYRVCKNKRSHKGKKHRWCLDDDYDDLDDYKC